MNWYTKGFCGNNCEPVRQAGKQAPPPVAFKVMCLLPITLLYAWVTLI